MGIQTWFILYFYLSCLSVRSVFGLLGFSSIFFFLNVGFPCETYYKGNFLKRSYKLKKKKKPYILYKAHRSDFSLSLSKLALFKTEVLFRSTRTVRNLTYIFTFIMTNIAASSNIIFISFLQFIFCFREAVGTFAKGTKS